MNFKHIWIVFVKEMKDSFRDRKSVLTNILLPLILIPVIYFFMNMGMKSMTSDAQENMNIAIITNGANIEEAEKFTKDKIIGQDNFQIIRYDDNNKMSDALIDGEIKCIIEYGENFFSKIESGNSSQISLKYNSTKNASQLALQMLQSKIGNLNQQLAAQKLTQINISPEILNLVSITPVDEYIKTSSTGSAGNQMLMMIIPMYLVIVIVTAGIPLAIDIIAGERERNTFEALLSTKANRLSILLGKYMAILVFSIIAIIMSFIGLILGILISPEMFSAGAQTMNLSQIFQAMNMPISALLLALLSSITLAVVFAGIQIAISTMAKTVKEAQTYLSYMMFPAMIIAFATMFMGAGDMQTYMAFIPIFNTIASLKMVLGGIINNGFLALGILTNIVFIGIVTAYIIRLFNNEKVIIK